MRALLVVLFGLLAACSSTTERPEAQRFSDHVAWLAADAREGRQTGTKGLDQAGDYMAEWFGRHGFKPAGDDGGWRQSFHAQGSNVLADGNQLYIGRESLEIETEWVPFASSAGGSVEGPVVFAGYGITTSEGDERSWNDYEGIDVKGAVVVLLRRAPLGPGQPEGTGWWLAGTGQRYATTSGKINFAYKNGAAGVVIVNDPRGHGEGGAADVPIPYGQGGAAAVSSIPAISMTFAAAQRAFGDAIDFDYEQAMLDHGNKPHSHPVEGRSLAVTIVAEREEVETFNVVARLEGSDPELAHEYVLVGAHVDHLGWGRKSGSMGGPEAAGKIHNGADDNASGCAGLLEIARWLGSREVAPKRSVVLVAFGAEEWGLLGSRHWVKSPTLPLKDCVGMVNMDMIGRSGTGRVEVGGVGTADEFEALLDGAAADVGQPLELVRSSGVTGNSDHAPFVEERIPTLTFFTGLHDDYHKPSDDPLTIDADHGASIAALAGLVARSLADMPTRPLFTEPKSSPSAKATAEPHDGQEVVGYGVSFGSQPDMTYEGDDGVRISGVRGGSPADVCGVQAGDVIIAVDGTPVRNLEDYAVLLFSHRPGDEIVVTVRRGDEELDLTAVLEGRRGDT